jgi:hypothetical protein
VKRTTGQNSQKALSAIVILASAFLFAACGVRGRPQPPLTPAELGRGKPTFKRATEEFRFKDVPSPNTQPDAQTEATPVPRPRPSDARPTKPNDDRN